MMSAATATASAHTSSSAAASLLPHLPPAREIPSSFISGIKSWWEAGSNASAAAEERILRRIPYFRPSSVTVSSTNDMGPVVAHSTKVELSHPKHYLNTLTIASTSPSPDAPPPAVLLHGYGAGLAFFFKNYLSLGQWAAEKGSSVYAVDWLGMGRSARVPFSVKAKRDDIQSRVNEAESFFVDSLEDWRQKMGLEKMTLIGHSLGAYLSVAYALRHPARVSKLILLSPAGVPRDPNNTTMPAKELTDTGTSANGSPADAEEATKANISDLRSTQKQEKRNQTRMMKVFTYLWEEGWSPFQVVRSTLFYGPILVGKYSSRRFGGFSDEETRDMHDYILNITLAKGSGEYCISHILAPGAYARLPLVDRIAALKIPVTFAYGDHDWMDPAGGAKAVENLRQAGNTHGRMYVVKHAGHHLYLDNPTAVNDLLIKELNKRVK